MSAIRKRLGFFAQGLPKTVDKQQHQSTFTASAEPSSRHFLAHHQSLEQDYKALCARIARHFLRPDNQHLLIEELKDALMVAELLQSIYGDYLNVPREANKYLDDIQFYQNYLKCLKQNIQFSPLQPKQSELGISAGVKDISKQVNWLRLFSLRLRRMLLLINPLLHESSLYTQWFKSTDKVAGPILAYFAWMFFIPRFAVNVGMFAKHLLPGPWMGEQEAQLKWQERFWQQLKRRWFDLGNDSVWIGANLINCFVMAGALAPFALYVSLGLQAFDVVFACLRAAETISRLHSLKSQYTTMLDNEDLTQDEKDEIHRHIDALDERIAHEYKAQALSISNTIAIFMAISLALPFIAVHPVIPLLGAIAAVMTTVALYALRQGLEQQKPVESARPSSPAAINNIFGLFAHQDRENGDDIKESVPDDNSFENNQANV